MPSSGVQTCADRKSTRLNSSHLVISYAVFCLKKKNISRCADVSARVGGPRYSPPAFGTFSLRPGPMGRAGLALFFFFNDTATTEIYALSLHDALPICLIGNRAHAIRERFRNDYQSS